MAATPILPSSLNAEHLNRIIEVSWQAQAGDTGYRSSARGTLVRIVHERDVGTTVSVALTASHVLDVNLDRDGAGVTLAD
jgi:hypothetical protein